MDLLQLEDLHFWSSFSSWLFCSRFPVFPTLSSPLYCQPVFSHFLIFLRKGIAGTWRLCEMEQSSQADLNGEGRHIGFAGKRRMVLCRCFAFFCLGPGCPRKMLSMCSGKGFVCLFLSGPSYHLTAVCGMGQESIWFFAGFCA